MLPKSYPVPQREPPLSPRLSLPTMYDLPSEDPEEPGLPDEYHALQPQLLSRTFRSPCHSPEQIFTGTDLNLYYDVRHPLCYKRPDWFLAVASPLAASPSAAGNEQTAQETSPRKWEVYIFNVATEVTSL